MILPREMLSHGLKIFRLVTFSLIFIGKLLNCKLYQIIKKHVQNESRNIEIPVILKL